MSCSVIAFSNQKGGVGKSTSVVATAGCLLGRGNTVLVIDTDPQARLRCTISSWMRISACRTALYIRRPEI